MTIDAIRFRQHPEGFIVLQLLETSTRPDPENTYRTETVAAWRDAAATDLLDVARFTADYGAMSRRAEHAVKTATDADHAADKVRADFEASRDRTDERLQALEDTARRVARVLQVEGPPRPQWNRPDDLASFLQRNDR